MYASSLQQVKLDAFPIFLPPFKMQNITIEAENWTFVAMDITKFYH